MEVSIIWFGVILGGDTPGYFVSTLPKLNG